MPYSKDVTIPPRGEKIRVNNDGILTVPARPVIPYIQGDGIGMDIMPVMRKLVDTVVDRAYGSDRSIQWMEIYAGERANAIYGHDVWLPDETIDAIKEFSVAIKGPLKTPVGGGIRSLNVKMRQELDLYVCLRPVRHFKGCPSPLREPEKTDMVIFRENSEDIYAGIEWEAGSKDAKRVIDFLQREMGVQKIRFPETSGIGIKPISSQGTKRLVRRALQYTIDHDRDTVTLVHKGNIMKFTEGAFRNWGYEVAREEFGAVEIDDGGPRCSFANPKTGTQITVKDCIADDFLQQILLHPEEHSVIATLNLNGDYISDALAAQVGGVGMAPGANLSDTVALFEVTHGTAPGFAGKDLANPSSLILSAEMMLRHLGWDEAADMLVKGLSGAIASKHVTRDLSRQMKGSTEVSCSGFGNEILKHV